ncbi:MAG: YlbF family regulator [Verrucomicrobiota bacterium]
MQTTTEETTVTLKIKELCQAILDEPSLRTARANIDKFMADDQAKGQYENVMQKGQSLQQKQHQGQTLTAEEISAFEKDRDALLKNPVAVAFMNAQEELHHVHESVNKHVNKTLELGRIPTDEDMEEGSCGHGCGCGHGHSH